MPHLMGQALYIETGTFGESSVISLSYLTEMDALTALLPPGIQPANEPVVNFVYRHSDKHNFMVGPLNMIAVGVPVSFKGKEDHVTGNYWPVIWENDAMAVILGREIFGAAKLYGDITDLLHINGFLRGLLSDQGRPLIEVKFGIHELIEGQILEEIQKMALNANTIGWKHIPTPDASAAEISHATYYHSPNTIEKAWIGEGDVVFFETDSEVCFWTDHIIKTLRALPLNKCLRAVMTQGSGEHHISKGRVLK